MTGKEIGLLPALSPHKRTVYNLRKLSPWVSLQYS